tara:strand:+ start:119 stop:859 length:741 start_codon:yes stop_codon:yes gene_type:complete
MLEIKNLNVSIENIKILNGINLIVNPGEVHAIMGKNGSGKSTLSNVIAGNESYSIDSGNIKFLNKNLNDLSIEERALNGIFLSFQYPVALPGVNNTYFLKSALNAKRQFNGEKELDAIEFLKIIKSNLQKVKMDDNYLKRSVNVGFSGGEKKRNEILQMITLEPKLSILDETDSGLDIDALKIVADGIKQSRTKDNAFIVITHYQRMLNYLKPDFVHVLIDGKIVKTGGPELAIELEEKGYSQISY